MPKSSFAVAGCTAIALFSLNPAYAATFTISYYTEANLERGVDFTFDGNTTNTAIRVSDPPFIVGSMEIRDSALGIPNAFIPLNSADLMSFVADFGTLSFELPGDLLRQVELNRPDNEQLGVRLDGNGDVQRFDIPLFSASNSGGIWDDDPLLVPANTLTLWDEDPDGSEDYFIEQNQELYVLSTQTTDLFGLTQTQINAPTIITPLGSQVLGGQVGEWRLDTTNAPSLDNLDGILRITRDTGGVVTPAPLPATIWFLLPGLGLAAGLARRRQTT